MARQFKIFLDMDGVLTDFDKAVVGLGPEAVKGLDRDAPPEVKQVMYDAIEKAGDSFWANMPWMPDGQALWTWISQFKPVLLTSPGKFKHAVSGKTAWIKNNIPGTQAFFEEEKWRYVERRAILIDDTEKNIIAWQNCGGVGLLYTDFATLKDELLLAINKISPSRAEKQIAIQTLQEIHRSLQAKRVATEYLKSDV